MKHWSRIDLHTHTNHDIDCKKNDIPHGYTHRDYLEFLKLQQVKLKAVTNHNNIDIAEHVKHALIADMLNVNHLVGVEIDYKFYETEFHAITILSPNVDVILFTERLKNIRDGKENGIYLNIEDFSNLHKSMEFIFIPHAIKHKGILEAKTSKLDISTIDWVVKAMMSGISQPVLLESTRDYHIHSIAEKINHIINTDDVEIELPCYVGSDYKFDANTERKKKASEKASYSINSQPTYRGLEIALRNYETRLSLDEQIINRERFINEIKVIGNHMFKESKLKLSPGLNVIIGNSGSGKTMLLNQIYYQIKGESLTAAQKKENGNKKNNEYSSKIGGSTFLDIEYDVSVENNSIKILEIPNIYSEILKSQGGGTSVAKSFGIDNIDSISKIIGPYKTKLAEYYSTLQQKKYCQKNGGDNITNIISANKFIELNKIEKRSFLIKIIEYNDNDLKRVLSKIGSIDVILKNEQSQINHFEEMKKIFSEQQDKYEVDCLIKKYKNIMSKLRKEKNKLNLEKNSLEFEKKLHSVINDNINMITSYLGDKETSVIKRQNTAESEIKKLIENLKNAIEYEIVLDRARLIFPYEAVKSSLENNKNEYARMTLDDSNFSIKSVDILDNPLINSNNIKGKLKTLNLDSVNFENSEDIKMLVESLSNIGINLSTIISNGDDIPKYVELYIKEIDEWKIVTNINKGDIAKKSIEYYFNEMIRDQQPDIILIDQPENDVDKRFITTTLSSFIREQKKDKQIIITSHDAIIAINSDANKIIEAESTEENRFSYISYDLEAVDKSHYEGTERVSEVLDGGKNNVKKRYQIYGGEIKYDC